MQWPMRYILTIASKSEKPAIYEILAMHDMLGIYANDILHFSTNFLNESDDYILQFLTV